MMGSRGSVRSLASLQQSLAERARAEIVGDTRLLDGLVARAERKDRTAASKHDPRRRLLAARHADRLWRQAERVEGKIERDDRTFTASMTALAQAERHGAHARRRGGRPPPVVHVRPVASRPPPAPPTGRNAVPRTTSGRTVPRAGSHGGCEVRRAGRAWVRCCEVFDRRGRAVEACAALPVRRKRSRASRRPTARSARRSGRRPGTRWSRGRRSGC